jgi:hypothetical protein
VIGGGEEIELVLSWPLDAAESPVIGQPRASMGYSSGSANPDIAALAMDRSTGKNQREAGKNGAKSSYLASNHSRARIVAAASAFAVPASGVNGLAFSMPAERLEEVICADVADCCYAWSCR